MTTMRDLQAAVDRLENMARYMASLLRPADTLMACPTCGHVAWASRVQSAGQPREEWPCPACGAGMVPAF